MTAPNTPDSTDPRFERNLVAAARAFVIFIIGGLLVGLLSGVVGRSIAGDVGTVVRVAGVVLLSPVMFFMLTSILIGLNVRLGWSPLKREPLAINFLAVTIPAVLVAINV